MRRGFLQGGLQSGFEGVRADYRVAKSSRMRSAMPGLPVLGANADWEFRNETDYYRILAMARYVDQNDPLVGQAVDRLVNLVFKTGMKYDAATGNPEADDYVKAKWRAWSGDPRQCDARKHSTIDDLAKLVFRATVVDGDHVVLPVKGRRLQCIEGHRMQTPRNARGRKDAVNLGVLRDAQGAPREYWLTKEDLGPFSFVQAVSEISKYPAYDSAGNPQVLHVFNPRRVSENRGVSCFSRLMENASAHADLQFAMLIKEQAAACLTILREMDATPGLPTGSAAAFGSSETVTNADGTTTTVHELRPGLEITGRPGEKLSVNAPNLPGDGFLKHSVQVLTFVAVNLGIPVQVLLLDPTQSNFSSWRGAMDIAKHGFVSIRQWMTTQFYCPIYEWWLRGELARDPKLREFAAADGTDIFGHQFTAPYDPYIDPSKDVTAEEKQVSARLDSRRNVLARRGLDLDEVDNDIVADQVYLLRRCAKAAHELNEDFPEAGFTWRDVYEVGATLGSPAAAAPAKAGVMEQGVDEVDEVDEVDPEEGPEEGGEA